MLPRNFALLLLTLLLKNALRGIRFVGGELFDASGRLIQVENAYQATMKSGTVLASKSSDSIIIMTITPKTFEYSQNSNRILPLNSQSFICGTGIASDVRHLTNRMFDASISHSTIFNQDMPLERLADQLSSIIHERTLSENIRPYGVSLILFGSSIPKTASSTGKDNRNPFKIIEIDPFGNVHDCIITCIGGFSRKIMENLPRSLDPDNTESNTMIPYVLKAVKDAIIVKPSADEEGRKVEDFDIKLFRYSEKEKKLQPIELIFPSS